MVARRPTPPKAPKLHVAEPAGAYYRRSPVVVDASVMAAALFGEDRHDVAVTMMQIRVLTAPHLLDCEIANVALKKLRRDRQEADKVTKALRLYAELDIARHPVDATEVTALADRYALSAYDAAYLWLAAALHAPLFTFDDKLARAARQHLSDPPSAVE